MLDVKISGINIFNPLDGKIDEIIEYYGKQHRKELVEKGKTVYEIGITISREY